MGKKKKQEFQDFRNNEKSAYKTLKIPLKTILLNRDTIQPIINNLVFEMNNLVIHAYQFIRLYILYCFTNNNILPELNDTFISYCIKTLGLRDNRGKKSKDTELLNKLNKADHEVRKGKWLREDNRGIELNGKTVGLMGYGNMGKAFAKKLRGFEVEVFCYDIKDNVSDENAKQVTLAEFQEKVDVLSLHTPQTPLTLNMINAEFISQFKKPFWFLNTARGKSVVTKDLVSALKSGKILGAGLDVLEYEKASFENLFKSNVLSGAIEMPEAFKYLIESENVLLTPHVAGWTVESKIKLAQTVVDKIKNKFVN